MPQALRALTSIDVSDDPLNVCDTLPPGPDRYGSPLRARKDGRERITLRDLQ